MSSPGEPGAAAPPAAAEPAAEPTHPDGGAVSSPARGRSAPPSDAAGAVSSPSLRVRTSASPPRPKYKRRKVALFLTYLGHEYSGMQHNPDVTTIESVLFEAIHRAGGISDANAEGKRFQKVHWDRAARTDRGVSAIGQVVSLQMILEPEGIIERINEHLPADIRVLGYFRTTSGFDSRKMCDRRRYEYVLPAWMFFPGEEDKVKRVLDEIKAAKRDGTKSAEKEATGSIQSPAVDVETEPAPETNTSGTPDISPAQTSASSGPSEPVQFRRFTPEDAARMTALLSAYVGTHSFHNFTPAVQVDNPASQRFIRSFVCDGAFDIDSGKGLGERGEQGDAGEAEGASHPVSSATAPQPETSSAASAASASARARYPTQWVKLSVVGQSFMLNQIRIMVGLALAAFRGDVPERALFAALNARRPIKPPMAPALGLYLDRTYYDSYNARFSDLHGIIDVDAFADRMDSFKRERLYPTLSEIDRESQVNLAWLARLPEICAKIGEWPTAQQVIAEREEAKQNKHKLKNREQTIAGAANDAGEKPCQRSAPKEAPAQAPKPAPEAGSASVPLASEQPSASAPLASNAGMHDTTTGGEGATPNEGKEEVGGAGSEKGAAKQGLTSAQGTETQVAEASAASAATAAAAPSLPPTAGQKRPAEAVAAEEGGKGGHGWGRGRGRGGREGGARGRSSRDRGERRKRVRKNVPYADELSD